LLIALKGLKKMRLQGQTKGHFFFEEVAALVSA
jgi:hypothetical protein